MSHFTVLVVGDNVEEQLQPYHEYECTGMNDQYVQNIDQTEEVQEQIDKDGLEEGLAYFGLEDRIVSTEEEVEIEGEGQHRFGYAVVQGGKLIKAVDRTNPNRQWDWYQIGGRWTGFFKLKSGAIGLAGTPGLMTPPITSGYADQAMLGDIDVAGMQQEARDKARVRYNHVADVFGGTIPALEHTWASLRDNESLTWDERRETYRNQAPLVQIQDWLKENRQNEALKEQRETLNWLDSYEDFTISEEEFLQKAADRAFTTFAVLKDGKWYEKGAMGWWGMVANEQDQDTWNREFTKLINDLPASTLLSVVDCHI
jgi:hypothetical protein